LKPAVGVFFGKEDVGGQGYWANVLYAEKRREGERVVNGSSQGSMLIIPF
jgi:hypothetical protein